VANAGVASEGVSQWRLPVPALWFVRIAGYGALVTALWYTLRLNFFTLAQIARAKTTVPWQDQWVVLDDLQRHAQGEHLWRIVWKPYWGHRLVIPRLLFFADAHWLSLASLNWLSLLLQFVHIALLIALGWLLVRRKPFAFFLAAVTLVLNLMLSPLQIENFVWGMQTMFPLVFVAASGAALALALSGPKTRISWLVLAIGLALLSSWTMPNGILIWPVLILQSLYMRQRRGATATIAVLGLIVIATYLRHYTRPPELGMGVIGMLRHPLDAVLLLCLVTGAPLRLKVHSEIVVGAIAMAVSAYMFLKVAAARAKHPEWISALLAIVAFSFLSAVTIVAGRLTPNLLHIDAVDPIPGRYFTMVCLIWAAMGLLALAAYQGRKSDAVWLCFYALLFGSLFFTHRIPQLTEAEDWSDAFTGIDALGPAFILNVPDEQLLSLVWPSKPERDQRIAFMKQRRLAIFSEARANWPDKRISDLFGRLPIRCAGEIEKVVSVSPVSARIEGWAWEVQGSRAPDDVLITDPNGQVVGLARGGLRHGYFPGLFSEPAPVPPPHTRFRHSEWLGYVRYKEGDHPAQFGLYGYFRSSGEACRVTTN
jgi:hypothetical protein